MHEDYGSHSVCMPDTTLAATYMYIDTYIHTYIGTANSPYVTLVFGARLGSPKL